MRVKKVTDTHAELTEGVKMFVKGETSLVDLFYSSTFGLLTKQEERNNPFNFYVKDNLKALKTKDAGVQGLNKLEELAKSVDKHFADKERVESGFVEYMFSKTLFDWQKNVLMADNKRNTLLCGRRSGKSFVESALAVLHCTKGYDIINGFKKGRSVVIMGLTLEKCKDVFWNNLQKYSELSKLNYRVDNAKLKIEFENGAFIQLVGNTSKTDREKLRGADYSMVIIDEAQSQNSLGYLMTDILGPIIKGRDSTVYLSGTGAITNKGYWKDITTGDLAKEWRHFTATMKDNPTIPENALQEVLVENKWDENDITYRREYLAENIIDLTRIVYPSFDFYEKTPTINRIAIGIDYGFNDSNAIVPLGLGSDHKIYELKGTMKWNRSDVTTIVERIKNLWDELIKEYKVDERNIICVADNSDQTISQEIFRHKIRIVNAYKVDRVQQIFDLREALKRKDVLIKSDLVKDEMESYVWKFDDEDKSVVYETDDEFYHPDCLAAFRYAFYYLEHL